MRQSKQMETRRMCPNCRAFITTRDRTCPYCKERVEPVSRPTPAAEMLGGFIPHARFVTMLILIINSAIYVATAVYSRSLGNSDAFFSLDGRTLLIFGAQNSDLIFHYGQWWRLLTAGFLHGGLLHIGMNMWVLFDLGAQVEEIYTGARMVVIYFVATVFGFLSSALWGNQLSVGASAGLFGLIGAMIALGVRYRHSMASAARGIYIRWAVYGILLGLLPGLRMDNAAHIGGLASGFAVAYLAGVPRIVDNLTEKFWRLGAYACVALTVYSFVRMYLLFSAVGR